MLSFANFITGTDQIAFAEYCMYDDDGNRSAPRKMFYIKNRRFLYSDKNWVGKLAFLDSHFESYNRQVQYRSRQRYELTIQIKRPIYRKYPVLWENLSSLDIMAPCDDKTNPTEIYFERNAAGSHSNFDNDNYRKDLLTNTCYAIMFRTLKLQFEATKQFSVVFDSGDAKEELETLYPRKPSLSKIEWLENLPISLPVWAEINNTHAKDHIFGFIFELKNSLESFRIKADLENDTYWNNCYEETEFIENLKLYAEGINAVLGVSMNSLEKVFDQLIKSQKDLGVLMELLIKKPR